MIGTASHQRWHWVWAAVLAAVLAAAAPGAASAQEASAPHVTSSSFTSVPTHRSSDWTVDGPSWVRPPESGGTYDTYESGDVIEVTHTFNEPVVVTGRLGSNLWVGGKWRGAYYASGSGTDQLKFHYTVVDEDLDLDGVKLQAGTTDHPGIWGSGTVTSQATGAAASTIFPEVQDPDHKVGPVPYINDIEIIVTDEEYVILRGETKTIETHGVIQLRVTYNTPVEVEGEPRFQLNFGPNEGGGTLEVVRWNRDARLTSEYVWDREEEFRNYARLVFEYYVEGGITDDDGISVLGGHIGGRIKARSGGQEAEHYDIYEWRELAEFEMDTVEAPKATGFEIISEPTHNTKYGEADNTYDVGDEIEIEVTFSEPIISEHGFLPGPAILLLNVGGELRAAVNDLYERPEDYEDEPSTTEVFTYVVGEDDEDADGISIDAVSEEDVYEWPYNYAIYRRIGFNTHIVSVATGTKAAAIHDGMAAQSGHRIGNIRPRITGAEVVSSPAEGDTYSTSETIEVGLTFDVAVEVSDGSDGSFASEVHLHIDDEAPSQHMRTDTMASASYARGNGTDTIVFAYTLTGGESDPDGITIYGFTGDITTVNGGTTWDREHVFDQSDTTLGTVNLSGHKVDAPEPPAITSIEVSSTPEHRTPDSTSDDTYNAGDIIDFKVTFDQPVRILNEALALRFDDPERPGLDIDIGGTTRRAVIYKLAEDVGPPTTGAAAPGTSQAQSQQAEREVFFFYIVQADDLDTDGVSVGASTAAGAGFDGSVVSKETGLTASAAHAGMPDQAGHLVGGLQPDLVSVEVTGTPADGETYYRGETIQITLNYNTPVTVDPDATGVPWFQIIVGENDGADEDALRDADYTSGSGTTALVFEYTVAAGDSDTDGMELLHGPWFNYDEVYATSGGLVVERAESASLDDLDTSTSYNVSGTLRQIGGV